MTEQTTSPTKLNFREATFLQSASAIENAPADSGWEWRLPADLTLGKSSAINTLTEQTSWRAPPARRGVRN